MKLTTNNGELDLPVDFSFEVELNNPFFSDEGDSTIPATLPATPNNLKVFDNIHRVDRASKFMKSVPATLMAGTIQKHGQLVIDTMSIKNGIDVSLAIENSDIYSQYKEKSLKEIFASKVRDEWNKDISELANYLWNVRVNRRYDDFTLFPVAVAPYEESDNKIYQYNNEGTNYLVWQARTVREGDLTMSVTDGYGVSPFLYLYKMIDLMFEQMGYYVVYNCLDRDPYKDIVLLNNCSDTIVKGVVNYSDLVPSCTLSEFLDFLLNKFGILCRVDSTSQRVRVVMFQEILSTLAPDMDITNKVVDDLDIILDDTSRVVLSSETSIDGSAPAAETFDKLIEKYGYYIEITEGQYTSLLNNIPIGISDCLVMRKETGQFYELRRKIGSNEIIPTFLGTNYFKYDRNNSSNQESYSSPDVAPAIIYDRLPYMYIGDRQHRNTSYQNTEDSSDQSIMIAWKTIVTAGSLHLSFGTTQKYFDGRKIKDFSLTSYDMYEYFWSNYNNLLLNGKVTLKGEVLYDYHDMMTLDVTRVKIYKGQPVIPLKVAFSISEKLKNGHGEYLLAKSFFNRITDKKILPETQQKFKWEYQGDKINSEIANIASWFPYYFNAYGEYLGNGSNYTPNNKACYIMVYTGCLIEIINGSSDIYIGIPISSGENSISFEFQYSITPQYKVYTYPGEGQPVSNPMMINFEDITGKDTAQYHSVPV